MATRQAAGPDLTYYSRFIRQHRVLLVLAVLVGVACGVLYQQTQAQRYKSVSSVALEPLPTHVARDGTSKDPEYMTIDTDGELAKSTRVLNPVAESIGEPVSEVRNNLLVTASPLSSVLHLALTAATPRQAQVGAQTAAESLLRARASLVRSSVSGQSKQITDSIEILEQDLLVAGKSFDTARAESLNDQIVVLRRRLRELQLVQRSAGRIISAAELPDRGAGLSAKVAWGSGALLGLLGGVVLAKAREWRSRRLAEEQRHAQWGATGSAASAGG